MDKFADWLARGRRCLLGAMSTARRIREFRSRTGKSETEVAQLLGINIHWYYDLEMHDDELTSTLSLAQALELAAQLGVSLHDLLAVSVRPENAVMLQDLPKYVERHLVIDGITVDEFSDRIGWDLAPFLGEPVEVGSGLPIMFFQDLADGLGIPWPDVLPHSASRDSHGPRNET